MKARNIILSSVLGLFVASAFIGCGKTSKMQSQLDSLYTADSLHQEDIRQMADFVNTMSIGLDSISAQEGVLQQMGSREGGPIDKEKMKAQLSNLSQLLKSQRARLDSLQQEVKDNNSAYGKRIQKLIAYYKGQIDEKDKKIAELQEELNKKDTDIAKLTENVNELTTTNTALTETVDSQKTAITEKETTIAKQDETIHTGFVAIGTSKELTQKGLIKGGFLAKKKFDASNANPSNFQKIDIRNYNDIRLNSSNPKVMTQMPAGSYEIQKNGNGTSTLHIKDAATFWSVSKYLVVKL